MGCTEYRINRQSKERTFSLNGKAVTLLGSVRYWHAYGILGYTHDKAWLCQYNDAHYIIWHCDCNAGKGWFAYPISAAEEEKWHLSDDWNQCYGLSKETVPENIEIDGHAFRILDDFFNQSEILTKRQW